MDDRQPAFNLPPVIVWSAGLLLAIQLVLQLLPFELYSRLLLSLAYIPARAGEAAFFLPGGTAARLWTPLTYALLHGGWLHLAVNLLWMASFGSAVARRFGTARFLLLSTIGAAAGALAHHLAHPGSEGIMVGASAAISAQMAAAVRFAFAPGGPLGGGRGREAYAQPAPTLLRTLLDPRPLAFLGLWFGINLLFGMESALIPGAGGDIAWQAHIGGFLAGLLLFPLLDPIGREPPPLDDL
ncbi:MAG TPA: rhomboid family intramembrane serine protease [Afifellaceae bacterium]|nr:rhomboid family intramembrane serine protease [Afifellaceae bacterium]